MSQRYTFVLNFGYVESASLSYMPWVSKETYRDAKAALVDLAEFLKEQYLIQVKNDTGKCCSATLNKDAEADHCTKCGARLPKHGFDGEEFIDWLRQVNSCDTDSLSSYIEWDPEHRWQAGNLEGGPNQRFVYQAEWVLAAAIGEPYNAERTFEEICKERTKSRKQSFSYY